MGPEILPKTIFRRPTSLSQSIRLRLAKVEERDPALDLVLKLCSCMGGSMTLVSAEVREAPTPPTPSAEMQRAPATLSLSLSQ